jgi:hypothetical protein
MTNGANQYTMTGEEKKYAWTALVLFVVLIFLSAISDSFVGPDPWLIEWTAWGAKYAALAVALHKVWKLSDAATVWLRK